MSESSEPPEGSLGPGNPPPGETAPPAQDELSTPPTPSPLIGPPESVALEAAVVEPAAPAAPRPSRWRRLRRALRVDRRTLAVFMRGALGLMILGFCLAMF